jgi:hypothetical protein
VKADDLSIRLKEFRDLLREHYALWSRSLDERIPDQPIRNIERLEGQQRRLHQLFYVLNGYLDRFTLGRQMHHPATGLIWDVYRGAIGNHTASIKGDSIRNALLELEGIISRVEVEDSGTEIEARGVPVGGTKRIFISHGKESKALVKLERFLRVCRPHPRDHEA